MSQAWPIQDANVIGYHDARPYRIAASTYPIKHEQLHAYGQQLVIIRLHYMICPLAHYCPNKSRMALRSTMHTFGSNCTDSTCAQWSSQ